MISDSEKRKQEKFHQGQFHVIYPIMCSTSYCQFVISPSPCRVVHVAVMRSIKQTTNRTFMFGSAGSGVRLGESISFVVSKSIRVKFHEYMREEAERQQSANINQEDTSLDRQGSKKTRIGG